MLAKIASLWWRKLTASFIEAVWPLWLFLVFLGCIGLLAACPWIEQKVEEKREEMFYSLFLRAESLVWAMEGVARVVGTNNISRDFGDILAEMGRQPGIAWLAIVDNSGKIIMDSHPVVTGQQLYSRAEMSALAAGSYLKGRFSPDDPQVFETWRYFLPHRFGGHGHKAAMRQDVIFIALDAANFHDDVKKYSLQLWLTTAFAILAFLSALALINYISRYRISSRHLAETQALATQVIKSYPAPLVVTDAQGRILLKNGPADRFFQFEVDQQNILQISNFKWQELFGKLTTQNPVYEQELQWLVPSGELIPIILSAVLMENCQNRKLGYLIIVRELTQIRRLEQQLEDSRRLSAMGKLASGVAHEIRNPLSSICGYACYLRQRLKNDPMGEATAKLLQEETERLNSALSDLLALARRPQVKPAENDADAILKKIKALIQPDADAKNINVTVSCESHGHALYCDRDRIIQTLLNLALNAVQAMAANGKLELTAQWLNEKSPDIPPLLSHSSGCWKVEVKDNGPGIAPGDLAQIFTPYFTTRAEGTGLGLTMARQIVEAHHGVITVASLPQEGATFSIYLPGAERE